MKTTILITILLSLLIVFNSYSFDNNNQLTLKVEYNDGTTSETIQRDSPSNAIHFDVYKSGATIVSASVEKDGEVIEWTGNGGDEHNNYDSSCTEVYWHWILTSSNMLIISSSECNTTIELQGACFRMLSSPSNQSTYSELLTGIFTQGRDVVRNDPYHIQAGDPNVWTFDTDWDFIPNLDNNTVAGQGILLSMFEDQSVNSTPETDPVPLTVSGLENEAPVSISMNDGWNLLGNPFYSSIDLTELDFSGTEGVVYVWDRNSGNWRYYSNDGTTFNTNSSIEGNKLSPYQGFFIESNIQQTFTFTNDVKTAGGTFYGKSITDGLNYITLEVENENRKSSTTISFNNNINDVKELQSLSEEFLSFSAVKDGTLVHVGDFLSTIYEIPLNIKSSKNGTHTIKVDEINTDKELYFIDTYTSDKILITDNFEYSYTVVKKELEVPTSNKCNMNITSMEKSNERFLISINLNESTLPSKITLNQNYPNPFNPSTQIKYTVSNTTNVSLQVFDMLGRSVEILVNEKQSAGEHIVRFDASNLPSGTYMYRLSVGNEILNKTMTLIK